jgi:hypothetical protein
MPSLKEQIKEHMEVVGRDGLHVGTLDGIDGNRIRLTKSDSADERHHWLEIEHIARVEGEKIHLKLDSAEAQRVKQSF